MKLERPSGNSEPFGPATVRISASDAKALIENRLGPEALAGWNELNDSERGRLFLHALKQFDPMTKADWGYGERDVISIMAGWAEDYAPTPRSSSKDEDPWWKGHAANLLSIPRYIFD